MADLKISQLTAITTLTPATDVLPVVDVTGTTKKITTNQILGSGGTATLASATITGNLTVDTNTFFVDSANDNVGIGTTSPTVYSSYRTLAIVGKATGSVLDMNPSGGPLAGGLQIASTATSTNIDVFGPSAGAAAPFIIRTGAYGTLLERYRVAGDGVATWSNVGGVAGTAMTLNSTGLAVGTSNFAYKINAAGFIAAVDPSFTGTGGSLIGAMLNNDNAAPGLDLRRWTGTAGNHGTTYISTDSTGATFFYNGQQASNTKATSLKMTIDASGNVGVGVTPAGTGGCLQLKSGITFPATQVASSDANTLDDYEEGTFTATLNSGTFTSQVFKYTKIGNMVTVFFDVIVGTGGGDRVTNLPFTAAGTVANGIYTNAQTYAAGTTAPTAVIGGSSTVLFFRTVGTGVAFSAMTLTAGAAITGSISYFV